MQLATDRATSWRANAIRRQRAERERPVVTRVAYRPDLHEITATVGLHARDSIHEAGILLELGTHQRAVLLEALYQRERSRALAGMLTMLAALASIAILVGSGQAASGWWAVPILAFTAGLDLLLSARRRHRALTVLRRQVTAGGLERVDAPRQTNSNPRDEASR